MLYRLFRIILLTTFIVGMSGMLSGQENTWDTKGPYNCRTYDIAIDPANSEHIVIGTIEYGFYQSFDGGLNWGHIDDELLPSIARVINFHPLASDTIYVTTSYGLYKSPNSGINWERIYFPTGWQYAIDAFAIFESNPNILLASGPILSGINYRSINGGDSWEELNIPLMAVKGFFIDPKEDSVAYFITHAASYRNTIYRSQDYGEDWSCIHNDLDTTLIAWGLAVDPQNNNKLYICGNDVSGNGNTIYKSINCGQNWINISPSDFPIEFVRGLLVSPADSNLIFAATFGSGLLRSNDAGETWEEANEGFTGRKAKVIKYDPINDIYYLGTYYESLYRSRDGCRTWEKISRNISHTSCTDMVLVNSLPSEVFVSAYNGIYHAQYNSESWEFTDVLYPDYNRIVSCLLNFEHGENYFIAAISPNYPYSCNPAVLVSTDNFISWETFDEGLPDNITITKMRVGYYEGEAKIFISSSRGLFVSSDLGESFTAVNVIPQTHYSSMDISRADNNYIYTGTYDIYCSNDGGNSWQDYSIPQGEYINEIICHSYDPLIVYICCFHGGVFKSEDAGYSWTNITNNLPYDSYDRFSGLAINPENSENILVNSHHYGVFESCNGGESWAPLNESLNTLYSNAVTVYNPADTNIIYLATDQQSVWSITRTGTGIDDVVTLPEQFALSAYPNPFNAQTQISFSLPQASDVVVDIYDILGRKAENLLNSYLPAGNHTVLWQAYDLPSGVYFYRLTAGDYHDTRKITLLK